MPLSVVATPIGNLEDISGRAIATLQSADLIYAEDTRVTQTLLKRYGITTPLKSYHQHSASPRTGEIIAGLKRGQHIALVTDAGTPGIADPGNALIAAIVAELGFQALISPIPGANAAIAALSISGFPTDSFLFLGFLPHKKGRAKKLTEALASAHTTVLYESPHRIHKLLAAIVAAGEGERNLVIARELTKKFEQIERGTAAELCARQGDKPGRGEYVVVIKSNIKSQKSN